MEPSTGIDNPTRSRAASRSPDTDAAVQPLAGDRKTRGLLNAEG
jgi:hypothetical protein